jgi:hypothetical protein
MNRKLIALNVVLVGLLVYAGVQFRSQRHAAKTHAGEILNHQPPVLPPPAIDPLPPRQPVSPLEYNVIAQKMLADRSRNPDVPVELPPPPPPPPPMPALPLYHGAMALPGEPPTVFLSLIGGPQQGIRPGETIGAFKLLDVTTVELVLEWDGKAVHKRLDDVKDKTSAMVLNPSVERTVQPAAPPPPPQQKAFGPSGEVNQFGGKACMQNDSYAPGAVVDGFRKVVAQTAFGPSCRWDPVGR